MNLDALAAKYTNLARPLGTTNASREKIKAAILAALAQVRAEALEEAAKYLDEQAKTVSPVRARQFSAAIRSLKEKP